MQLTIRVILTAVSIAWMALPTAAATDLTESLSAACARGGLVVHVGCGEGERTVALRSGPSTIVQGLDTESSNVARTLKLAASLGLSGRVSAAIFDGRHLPFIDNVVNVLVVDGDHDVTRQEMLRVLAPGGTAIVGSGGTTDRIVKPRPGEIDDWTHYLHGPTNNAVANDTKVGPPRHMQWLAGPRWTRTHHGLNSISAIVTAGGRMFSIVDNATAASREVTGQWSIVARDAFNGVLLWTREMDSWVINPRFRSGPPQVTRLMVTGHQRVFAPLGLGAPITVMDAATGKTLTTYADTASAEEMVLVGRTLLVLKSDGLPAQAAGNPRFKGRAAGPTTKTVLAIDTEKGKTLWQWPCVDGKVMPETLGSDGSRVFLQIDQSVSCLDLKSGDLLWQYGQRQPNAKRSPRMAFGQSTLVIADEVVLCNLNNRLTAISAGTGKLLWDCKGGMGFHAPMDVFVINGLVWRGSHVKDSVAPPPTEDFSEGRDLHTGKVIKTNTVAADLQTAGHHHRCYREKATVRYIITGKRGFEMMDLVGEQHSRNNWVRGTCQYGMLPANGLTYAPPHSCSCYMESKLTGFWALGSSNAVVAEGQRRVADANRLIRGPAYGDREPKVGSGPAESTAWNQYRGNATRSGAAAADVAAKLAPTWKTDLGTGLTAPVVAEGKIVVAAPETAQVYALDEESGRVAWQVEVGGRVDSPPAIHHGLVLFGSADGNVYCLRLRDGSLVWKFLAAPADLKTVAMEQVESLWPVHGSVLMLDNVVYFAAGRSTWLDHGIDLFGLDPISGEILYKSHLESRHPKINEGKERAKPEYVTKNSQNTTDYKTFLASDRSNAFSMAEGAVNDVLTSDGINIFLHHIPFDAELHRQAQLSRHLFSTSGMLDDTENHRSHWVLGTGDFKDVPVAYSWIVNGRGKRDPTIAVPTGLMMAFDDRAVWAVERRGTSGTYVLSMKENEPFSLNEAYLPDFRPAAQAKHNVALWTAPLTIRPRALLKAGAQLYVGGARPGLPNDDPHALYEGRTGGVLYVASTQDGSEVAEYPLDAPVVWDGLAAANGKLFVSTEDGHVHCFRGR